MFMSKCGVLSAYVQDGVSYVSRSFGKRYQLRALGTWKKGGLYRAEGSKRLMDI